MVELPGLAVVGSSCGLRWLKAVGSSHGLAVDPFDDQFVRQTAPAFVKVPLLSQEGPTRRLLPGAAAPWSPAFDPVLKFPAVARFVFVVKKALAAALSRECRSH